MNPISTIAPHWPLARNSRQLGYRPEIDGLRALAVGAVIVNHLRSQWLPSGHFGVDIFFVISGFVITQSLCAHRYRSFAELYVGFMARRMRRLAPTLLLCVAATGAAVWLLVPDPRDSLQTGLYALFGLSNLFLYFQHVDYFTPSSDLNVFLHTWSLGVEEQFYLFFPAIFWACAASERRGRLFGAVIGALCVASLAASIMFVRIDSQANFYLMPFRFWELGAGVLLFALKRDAEARALGRIGASLAIIASVLLIASLFLHPDRNGLLQCGVVVLTMIAIQTIRLSQVTFGVFGNRTTVFVGLISYPLYLWHWSVLSLSRWANFDQGWVVPLQLATMFLLSIVTYRYVEKPLRYAALLKPNWRAIGVFVVALVCCAVTVAQFRHVKSLFGVQSATVRWTTVSAPPFVPLTGSGLSFEPTCVVDGDKHPLRDNTFDLCTVRPKRPDGQMIWTLGDSHAGHLQALLSSLHDRTGVGVHLIETPGVAFPMPPGKPFEPRRRIYDMIAEKLRPGDIVLLGRLFLDRTGDGMFEDVPEWSAELVKFAEQMAARKVNVVVVGPPPMFHFNTLLSCWRVRSKESVCEIDRTAEVKRVEEVQQILRAAARQSDNIFLFDPFAVLCPAGAAACSPFRNGEAIFRDKDHLNSLGAEGLADAFVAFLKADGLLAEAEQR
jgi:peptidoglycan/LPS O-acetylase OafA/YrhL